MKTRSAIARVAALAVVAFGIGYGIQSVRAAVAVAEPLYYSGLLTQGGVAASGIHNLTLRVWNGGATACPDASYTGVQLANGRFRLALADACTDAVKANPSLAVEVLVDNVSLGRSTMGMVPYAAKADAATYADQAGSLVGTAAQSLVPPGTIVAYGGTTAPPGWLMCDGAFYPIGPQYQALFDRIGWAFGKPDANSFNVPDLRGRFLRGVDNGAGTDHAARDPDRGSRAAMNPGGLGTGNNVGSVQDANFASHNHAGSDLGHAHYGAIVSAIASGPVMGGFGTPDTETNHATVSQTGYANISIGNTGGNETRPVNAYVNFIIKY
jgi:microcystin-dependent protein